MKSKFVILRIARTLEITTNHDFRDIVIRFDFSVVQKNYLQFLTWQWVLHRPLDNKFLQPTKPRFICQTAQQTQACCMFGGRFSATPCVRLLFRRSVRINSFVQEVAVSATTILIICRRVTGRICDHTCVLIVENLFPENPASRNYANHRSLRVCFCFF